MKVAIFGCLMLWLVGPCFGQLAEPLCPRYIQTPFYSLIARTAPVQGKIVLSLTIDAGGNVKDAEVTNGRQMGSTPETQCNFDHSALGMSQATFRAL